MKKCLVILVALSLSASLAFASMKYECWAYRDGKPDKMVHVTADSKSEAQNKAEAKFRDLDIKFDYVKCH